MSLKACVSTPKCDVYDEFFLYSGNNYSTVMLLCSMHIAVSVVCTMCSSFSVILQYVAVCKLFQCIIVRMQVYASDMVAITNTPISNVSVCGL